MAEPDPHMNEMRIMAYDYRQRECKALRRVPRRNDFILVLWYIDYRPGNQNEWCLAEVLHLSDSPEQDALASGVILYMPTEDWGEQSHHVDFLENFKVRRSREEGDENLGSNKNENPLLPWKFSFDKEEDSSARRDEDWMPGKARNAASSAARNHGTNKVRQEDDSQSLRSAYASLSVEMQKMKRELVSISQQLSQKRNFDIPRQPYFGSGCVIPRLRHRLALRLQGGLRSFHTIAGKRDIDDSEQNIAIRTGNGIHAGAIRARVECSLQQFEIIARQIMATAKPGSAYFFPDFSYTQLPLQSSAAFRILLGKFSDLADCLNILSTADRLEMVRKCGTGPQGDLLRLVGTYSFSKKEPTKPAYIYLGTSCGGGGRCLTVNTEDEAAQLYPILVRDSGEWNKIDRRFVHKLRSDRAPLPILNCETSELEAFGLHWKRAPDLSSRTWSRALVQPAQVFGYLEATLPFIQTQGKYLCTEVGGLACDDVWSSLLQ